MNIIVNINNIHSNFNFFYRIINSKITFNVVPLGVKIPVFASVTFAISLKRLSLVLLLE